MTKYVINIELSFDKKPKKFDVECKLWDLMKEGFVLKTKRRKDKQIGKAPTRKSVVLPTKTYNLLRKVQKKIAKEVGFPMPLTNVIAHLVSKELK